MKNKFNHSIITILFSLAGFGALAINWKKVEQIASYNFDTVQSKAQVYYPENLAQAQGLIRKASESQVSIRFSGASHSTSSLILGPGIYLKSERLNRIDGIEMDPIHGPVVQVESGVKLGDLSQHLSQKGYSLGFGYPFYYGVTIGGLLSTGSHGSSRRHTALSAQNVVQMQIVNGRGDLLVADSRNPNFLRAARVSLGLLGFIYKVKLKIIPDFKLAFYSEVKQGNQALLSVPGQVNWGPIADTEYFYWFPAFDRSIKVFGNATSSAVSPGAQSVVLGQGDYNRLTEYATLKALKAGMASRAINKVIEDHRFKSLAKSPPPYLSMKPDGLSTSQGVVGNSFHMLTSKNIAMNPVFTARDYSFAFRIQDAPRVMRFIHEYCQKNELYHPFLGIFLRFAKSDGSSYLSHIERSDARVGEVFVLAEFFEPKEYRPDPDVTVFSEMSFDMLQKLAAANLITFHWGKNTNSLFALGVNRNLLGPRVQAFESIRAVMDPKGIFLNDFSRQILLPGRR